jgi:hypothetical protein
MERFYFFLSDSLNIHPSKKVNKPCKKSVVEDRKPASVSVNNIFMNARFASWTKTEVTNFPYFCTGELANLLPATPALITAPRQRISNFRLMKEIVEAWQGYHYPSGQPLRPRPHWAKDMPTGLRL